MALCLIAILGNLPCNDLMAAKEAPASKQPCFGLKVGYLRNGIVYTLDDVKPGFANVRLWHAEIRPGEDGPKVDPAGVSRTLWIWRNDQEIYYLTWRIAYERFWSHSGPILKHSTDSSYIPMEDLPLMDTRNPDAEIMMRKKYQQPDPAVPVFELTHAGFGGPAQGAVYKRLDREKFAAYERMGQGDEKATFREDVKVGEFEYDFLPTGPTEFLGFLLNNKRLETWVGVRKPNERGWPEEKFKKAKTVEAGFQEPFLAYGSKESPFFVTRSGKLFRFDRPLKGPHSVVKTWDDPKRRIDMLLTETETGRTFASGPDTTKQAKGKRFYFALEAKPQPEPINESDLPVVKARMPLTPLLRFARLLDKQKKLSLK